MSRQYGMSVEIKEHHGDRADAIIAAAQEEWPFEDWYGGEVVTAYGESSLCGGESEEGFTQRLSIAIWKANGAYCQVVVDATYLEDLSFNTHTLDEDDYKRLMAASASPSIEELC